MGIEQFLSLEFGRRSGRIVRWETPYLYPTWEVLHEYGAQDPKLFFPLLSQFGNTLPRHKLNPYMEPGDESVAAVAEIRSLMTPGHLKAIEFLSSPEECAAQRESFIEKNIEGPCQRLVRHLMKAGKITTSSNAFAKGFEKGVWWYEPEDFFPTLMQKDPEARRQGMKNFTDMSGRTFRIMEDGRYVPHNIDLEFSAEVLPTEQDYTDWMAMHPDTGDDDTPLVLEPTR